MTTDRPIRTAELLSIGSELTVGETTDTNAGDVARSLVGVGVRVGRISGLPDQLEIVRDALRDALDRADLVVTTGGLGPTPDDLTREAVAAVCGETLEIDPAIERWLLDLFARRGLAFAEANRKQAWQIPSAASLANPNGTAPGWWVDRPDGRVIVCLPGPPREMRPMWTDVVLPRLAARGLGVETVVRTFRLAGIGESHVVDRLGELLLRAANPIVATYARNEAVDVRISAVADPPAAAGGPSPADLVDAAAAEVLAKVGQHVWAEGTTTWAEALDAALEARGWRLSTVEVGTAGALVGLLGRMEHLAFAELLGDEPPDDHVPGHLAERVRQVGASEVGLALRARRRESDMAASVGVVTPAGVHAERRVVFLTGDLGRHRAAIAAAHVLLNRLRADDPPGGPNAA